MYSQMTYDDKDDDPTIAGSAAAAAAFAGKKGGNILPSWGNASTMNINPLILTNIQSSPYFKVNLFGLKTYHEIIDEIYYKVSHLEPWERGSRSTAGQTGMCGGVRGVGAGGIVSSAYCLLFKLGTLKLTRKQLNGLLNHCDSPYIRGLGFMYIRYTQPPSDLWSWFEGYLNDEEEIDVKAGGGKAMTIGEMLRSFLVKLEWFDTRFPRIPVSTQKEFVDRLEELYPKSGRSFDHHGREDKYENSTVEARPRSSHPSREPSKDRERSRKRPRSQERKRSRSRERHQRPRSKDEKRSRRSKRSRSRNKQKKHKRSRSKERERSHHKSKKHDRHRSPKSYQDELRKYSEHRDRQGKHKRSRSRSR